MIRSPQITVSLVCFVLASVSSASAFAWPGPTGSEKLGPELAITNANIITLDPTGNTAEAIVVRGGRFVSVGAAEDLAPSIAEAARVLDVRGATVVPGFIDAHLHPRPIYPVESRLGTVDLRPSRVADIAALVAALGLKAESTPKGQWVRGTGYQDTKLGRHPTREDLDRASKEHPILIGHSSGHVASCNSLALRLAGIDENTPNPPGGAFDRGENGRPNGVLREAPARALISRSGPPLPEPSPDEKLQAMLRCFDQYVSKGITSVGVAGATPDEFRLYQDAVRAGLQVRIYFMFREPYFADLKKLRLRTGFGDKRLRIGGIKLFHGNSLSGRTCWLYEPYADRPDYYGIAPARTQAALDKLVFEIHQAGLQAAIHSNGDREIDMVLDAIAKALEELPKSDHRHRIEHCSVANERILSRAKQLGVVLALHSYIYEHGDKMEAYGRKRWGMMHPNRSAIELGIPVAGNSDSPVSEANPLLRIQSLVTRTSAEGKTYGSKQRLTVNQALEVFTLGAAYASFEEDLKGSISTGKLADCVVLSDDPRNVPPEQIKDIRVLKTIIGGKVVYDADADVNLDGN